MKKKFSIKQIKSPDQFRKTMFKAFSYMKNNVKLYLSIGIAIVLVTAISVLVTHINKQREEDARVKFYELAREIEDYDQTQVDDVLELIEAKVPELGNTEAALEARYILAEIYYSQEDWEQAIKHYKVVSRRARGVLKDLSLLGYAYARENSGDLETALNVFLRLKDSASEVYRPVAFLGAGRNYQKLGDNESALAEYESLILMYPDSNYARMASVAKTKM